MIGVFGQSQEEAGELYKERLAFWIGCLEEPEDAIVG